MRFNNYINELSSNYGKGITFIDIDETIFRTFALIYVLDKNTKEIINKLTNQEFNTYKLKDNEEFDFREFRSADLFNKTSLPIDSTIKRIKRMFTNIDHRGSKVVLLTARTDFDNKDKFLDTFKKYGIPIDSIYVERVGNFLTRPEIYKRIIKMQGMPTNTAEQKEKVILDYLMTGEYRRVRLIDDDMRNIKNFVKFGSSFEKKNPEIIKKIKEIHNIPEDEKFPVIQFFGLLVQENGSLKSV
jgi:anion-transporting  ArsA/GET3 family ATPase